MDNYRICRVVEMMRSRPTGLTTVLPHLQTADQFYSRVIAMQRMIDNDSPTPVSAALIPYHIDGDQQMHLLMSVAGTVVKRKQQVLDNKRIWVAVKGGYDPVDDNDSVLNAALREWYEETHIDLNQLTATVDLALGSVTQYSGKNVFAFAARCNKMIDLQTIDWYSDTVTINGTEIPETAHLRWMTIDQAQKMVYKPHLQLINRLHSYYVNNH